VGSANAAVEPVTPELEKVAVPPLTRTGRCLIAGYLLAGAVIFCLLRFPADAERLLHALNPNWHAPAPAPDLAGKSGGVQSLMAVSLLAIPVLLSFIPLYATLRGVKVYEQFVEGAQEAWATAQRTTPYLVAMLVAITMLQKSGVIDFLTHALQPALDAIRFPAELLPMVLMRPLSGSATNGLFVELVQRLHDPDGFISRLAGTIYGSTETTFYVLAVYFGSVSVRQSRHAIVAGLTADTVAVIASVTVCRLMFA
jgi:spore maturation protein B